MSVRLDGIKRRVGALVVAVGIAVCCFALFGCSAGIDPANFTGDWELRQSSNDLVDDEMIELMDSLDVKATLHLEGDGTATLKAPGLTVDVTWEATSNTEAKGTFDGAQVSIVLEDEALVMKGESGKSMSFERIR